MLGQPASWHTVCRPSRWTRPRRWVNSGPMVAFTLIHGGLRSIGVSALRASMRSRRRPSGTTVVTAQDYARVRRKPPARDQRHVTDQFTRKHPGKPQAEGPGAAVTWRPTATTD